jgi:ADP-ribose pyrophosphatase YjhB (NUDIX family)
MKREYPESPLVGVGAVIVQNHRVLLIRRGQPPLLGEWSLPGGVLECGETLREAVVREAGEETGLAVETGEMLGVYERVIRGDEGRVRYHYVLIDFLCCPIGGDLKAGSDAADVRWFTREELPALNLAHDANDVVLKGLARTMEHRASSPGESGGRPHTRNS